MPTGVYIRTKPVWNKGIKTGIIPKTAFKKGHVPWIKGKKGIRLSPRTEFKKGLIPWSKGKRGVCLNTGKTHFKKGQTSGKNNVNWKGGIYITNLEIRNSPQYREWHSKVLVRDDYTCQICRKRGGILEVDHIYAFSEYPELRFNLNNGRVLCKECHKTTNNFGWKLYNNKNTDLGVDSKKRIEELRKLKIL